MAIVLHKEVEFIYLSSRGVLKSKCSHIRGSCGTDYPLLPNSQTSFIEWLNNFFYPADKQTGILFRGNLA